MALYRLSALCLLLCVCDLPLSAQHIPVFPDLEGEALIQALQSNYRPNQVLSYADARDTLYAKIDVQNGFITCVYTGFQVLLPPNEDPTTAIFLNGEGINTEHTYPQAYGAAADPPRADMHHIFPTQVDANAARGNLPFIDIPDNQADSWWYLGMAQSNIPGSQIDLYSEVNELGFEPREAHKGDVARAMFYFYTVYRAEAVAANPTYFEPQRNTLCQWHIQDPVDDKEWQRSQQIATYQDGKANPFVLDCTVATRSYCSGVVAPCEPMVATQNQDTPSNLHFQATPNPASGPVKLSYTLPYSGWSQIKIYSSQGQLLLATPIEKQAKGEQEFTFQGVKGLLFCYLRFEQEWQVVKVLVN
ncbi:MAG TPA: endonuclease [Saprospiraceae bacterium]|nr:endonuclease [Saprospiraceae bacterium]HMQ84270.1 endonuclease [Saprospiraceae bacterium]